MSFRFLSVVASVATIYFACGDVAPTHVSRRQALSGAAGEGDATKKTGGDVPAADGSDEESPPPADDPPPPGDDPPPPPDDDPPPPPDEDPPPPETQPSKLSWDGKTFVGDGVFNLIPTE